MVEPTRCDDPHILNGLDTIKAFMMAGRAIFTIRNIETGNRITYRVVAGENDCHEVFVFTGTENSDRGHYSPLGTLRDGRFYYRGLLAATLELKEVAIEDGDGWLKDFAGSCLRRIQANYTLSEKQDRVLRKNLNRCKVNVSPIEYEDMRQKAFRWLWVQLTKGNELPDKVEVWHEGRCGACGRRLTVPESIAQGLGPVCAGLVAA